MNSCNSFHPETRARRWITKTRRLFGIVKTEPMICQHDFEVFVECQKRFEQIQGMDTKILERK